MSRQLIHANPANNHFPRAATPKAKTGIQIEDMKVKTI
jgi:hypothetical protein